MQQNPYVISAMSLAAGIGLGYMFAKNRLELAYAQMIEKENADLKEYYETRLKEKSNELEKQHQKLEMTHQELLKETPRNAVEAMEQDGGSEAAEALLIYQGAIELKEAEEKRSASESLPSEKRPVNYQGISLQPSVLEQELKAAAVVPKPFEPEAPIKLVPLKSDVREETPRLFAARTPEKPIARTPYMISFEDFDNSEVGYTQRTVTYFAGDAQIVDDATDELIEGSIDEQIGTVNLDNLGDVDAIYVRNEKFQTDFEVTRSMGKYSEEVLGEPTAG